MVKVVHTQVSSWLDTKVIVVISAVTHCIKAISKPAFDTVILMVLPIKETSSPRHRLFHSLDRILSACQEYLEFSNTDNFLIH